MSDDNIFGEVRGIGVPDVSEGVKVQLMVNNRRDLYVTESMIPGADLVSKGGTWQVKLTTGLAALTSLPTTTAGLSLWNGETGTSAKCYIIHSFGSVEEVIDATQADTTAIFAMLNKTPVTAPTDLGLAIASRLGRTYGGKARTLSAQTVTNDAWYGHGPVSPMAPAVAGANWKVNECYPVPPYIVPPGGQFHVISVKAGAAAAAQQFYQICWSEVLIDFMT